MTFNPAEKRDARGRWSRSAASALSAAIHGDVRHLEDIVRADQGPTRLHMPQLSGVPIKGSKADRLIPHQPGQEVDLTDLFKKELVAKGIKVTDTSVPISDLKPTQDQLVMKKVAGLAKFMLTAPKDSPVFEPIFVSNDNHVIDGHHRWAARSVRAQINGTPGETMGVHKIDLNIKQSLAAATMFMDEWGLPRAGTKGQTTTVSKFARPPGATLSLSTPIVSVQDGPRMSGKVSNFGGKKAAPFRSGGKRRVKVLAAKAAVRRAQKGQDYSNIDLSTVAALDLAFHPGERRDTKGRWADGGPTYMPEKGARSKEELNFLSAKNAHAQSLLAKNPRQIRHTAKKLAKAKMAFDQKENTKAALQRATAAVTSPEAIKARAAERQFLATGHTPGTDPVRRDKRKNDWKREWSSASLDKDIAAAQRGRR